MRQNGTLSSAIEIQRERVSEIEKSAKVKKINHFLMQFHIKLVINYNLLAVILNHNNIDNDVTSCLDFFFYLAQLAFTLA